MKIVNEFKKFAMRGNLVDMAVGFTVGAAFSTLAKSLVADIIMPPVGLLLGGMDFADLFLVLRPGTEGAMPYATLQDAQQAGAVTLNYGLFVNNLLALLLVAIAMFILIRMMNRVHEALEKDVDGEASEGPPNKVCPFCRQTVAFKASRCAFCTSELEVEPETPEVHPTG